jgi:hypothetical protein
MPRLVPVDDAEQIRQNLKTFKNQAHSHDDLFCSLVRNPRQTYWVYDRKLDAFGTSMFVGYRDMTFELYRWAHSEDCTERIHGIVSLSQIE